MYVRKLHASGCTINGYNYNFAMGQDIVTDCDSNLLSENSGYINLSNENNKLCKEMCAVTLQLKYQLIILISLSPSLFLYTVLSRKGRSSK